MWKGRCEVHEEFTPEEINEFKESEPGVKVIAHPECSPEVLAESDFSGSTSAMINWVKDNQPKKVLMVTECSMSDNISVENPNVDFVRPCNLCPHMKTINLENILEALWNKKIEIEIDPEIADKAKLLRSWGRSSSLFSDSEAIENRFNINLDGIQYDAKFVFEEVGYQLELSLIHI